MEATKETKQTKQTKHQKKFFENLKMYDTAAQRARLDTRRADLIIITDMQKKTDEWDGVIWLGKKIIKMLDKKHDETLFEVKYFENEIYKTIPKIGTS